MKNNLLFNLKMQQCIVDKLFNGYVRQYLTRGNATYMWYLTLRNKYCEVFWLDNNH